VGNGAQRLAALPRTLKDFSRKEARMSSISVTVPHQLDPQEAVQRIQIALANAEQTYGDRLQEWDFQWAEGVLAYRFQAMGMTIQGTMTVEPNQVVVQAELPSSAWLFRGMIEKQIRQRLSDLLS